MPPDNTPQAFDPSSLATDMSFRNAPTARKIAYLSSVDPDFAKAPPEKQAGYINHILGNDQQTYFEAQRADAPKSTGEVIKRTALAPFTSDFWKQGYEASKGLVQGATNHSPVPFGLDVHPPTTPPPPNTENDDQRKLLGRSPLYRKVAGVGESIGVPVKQMEQQSDVGSPEGVTGAATPLAAAAVAPMAIKGAVGGTRALINKATTPAIPPGLSEEATTVLQNPAARRGTFKIQRALAPSGSNADFIERTAVAAPRLGQMDEGTPIAGATDTNGTPVKGGIIRSDQRLRFTVDNIENAQKNLWQTQRMPQIQRNAMAPTTTRAALTAGMSDAEVAGLEREFGGPIPNDVDLQTADRFRQAAASTLNKVNQMTPEGRYQTLQQNPILEKLDGIKKQLNSNISDVLTAKGEPGVQDFDRQYGAMQEVQDAARARMNPTEVQRVGDNATIRANPSMGLSILERLHLKPSPGRLLEQGLTELNEGGVRPPASTEPSPPSPAIAGLPGSTPPAQVAPAPAGQQPPPVAPQNARESVLPNQPQAIGRAGDNAIQVNTLPTEHPGEGNYAGLLPGPPAPFVPPPPGPLMPQVGEIAPVGFPVETADPMWTGEARPGIVPTRGPAASNTNPGLTTPGGLAPPPPPPVLSSPGGTPPAPIGTQGPAGPSPSTPAGVAAPPPPMPQTPGYVPSEKASTMSAAPRDLGPEFSQGQRQEMISRYRSIVRNPVATPVDLAEANARLQELGALQ